MTFVNCVTAVTVLGTIGCVFLHAQTQTPPSVPRVFDVVSIKANESGSESRRATALPGGVFTATNVPLKLLISRAYGVAEAQITGGPGWIETQKYDVTAKAATPLQLSREELKPCLQSMLGERFLLKVHHEARQGTVYSLSVAKGGPKLREHPEPSTPGISSSTGGGKGAIEGTAVTMARLAEYLAGQADRPVVDSTGLKGQYDFRVEWATEETPGGSEPSIFTALQEQLGLGLSAARGSIDTIVIDHAEKASAN